MDHENLKALLEVVKSGSIQGASRRLGLSRSLLRRRIDALEVEVGVPLLHRDSDGVRLTPAGSVTVEKGRALLESASALITDAQAAAREATGVVRVLEPIGVPLTAHVQTLLATHRAAPKLRLVLRQVDDPTAHLHEPFDLVLHEGPPPERGLWFSRVVVRQPLRVLASPTYLRARGEPRTVADLADHDVLGWKRPSLPEDVWPLLAGGTVAVSPWVVSPDFTLMRSLAAEGGGLLLGPSSPVAHEAEGEPLLTVLTDLIGCDHCFRVSTRHPTHSDSRTHGIVVQIQRLLDHLPDA